MKSKKINDLRKLFEHVSKPQLTLQETLGINYRNRVIATDKHNLKKVRRYEDDPTPDVVELDHNGRWVRVTNYGLEHTCAYDNEGYIVKTTLKENAGQGWDRKFFYEKDEDAGGKRLIRLEVTRYRGDGSTARGMLRGEQIGEVQVVNFDVNGNPDNLIPLWVYTG